MNQKEKVNEHTQQYLETLYKFIPRQCTTWQIFIDDETLQTKYETKLAEDLSFDLAYKVKYLGNMFYKIFPVASNKKIKANIQLKEHHITHIPCFCTEFQGDEKLMLGEGELLFETMYKEFDDSCKPSLMHVAKDTVWAFWILEQPIVIRNKEHRQEMEKLQIRFFDNLQMNSDSNLVKIKATPTNFMQEIPLPTSFLKITDNVYKLQDIYSYIGEVDPRSDQLQDRQLISNTLSDIPEDFKFLYCPSQFMMSDKGIYDKRKDKTATDTPILISKYMREIEIDDVAERETGKIILQVAALVRGRWIRFNSTPKELFDAKTVHGVLSENGVLIDSTQSKSAATYLKDFVKINSNTIQETKVYKQTGWHGSEFILPHSKANYEVNAGNSAKELRVVGDMQLTLELMQRAWDYPAARLMIDVNLAAPLLELVNCRNFCVNIHGRTEGGKTAAMQLANSIWGSPRWMYKFNATNNSIEKAGIERNSLPLNCNEWQTTDPRFRDKISNEIIHRYGEGTEKGRLNRNSQMRETKFFRGIMLITAEEPIVSESATGGVKTRILELEFTPAIGEYDEETNEMKVNHELCSEIYDVTQNNYGQIGREFISFIQDNEEEIRETYKQTYEWLMEITNDQFQASHLQYVSVLYVADYYFSRYFLKLAKVDSSIPTTLEGVMFNGGKLVIDNDSLSFFVQLIADKFKFKSETSDVARAKEFLQDFVEVHAVKFTTSQEKAVEHYGFYKDGIPYIYPVVLREALKKEGYSYSKICKELARQRAITYDENSNSFSVVMRDSNAQLKRVIGLIFLKE